jgi:glycosyltransferase involved in cell wall biosynthesis
MENKEKIFLSVVIPAYNEEKRLPKTIVEIFDYLSKKNFSFEVIVVNDGSKDKTSEVVKELMKKYSKLELIDNKENKGKGAVVRQGMLKARGEIRIFSDADHSTPISEIEKFIPEFEKGADVVIGSREIKGAILDPPQPLFRRFVGEGFKILRKIIVGLWSIQDTQCGFKCFRAEVVEKVFPKCKIDRFAFDPEILILAKKTGYKIKEVPVYWRNDPDSKVKFKSIFNMAKDLLRIRMNLILGKYGK